MRKPRIAINGFGRIGRAIARIAKQRGHFDLVAVNDLSSAEQLAHALKYDTVHGIYPGEVVLEKDAIEIDGDPFTVLGEADPSKLPWHKLGIDYVIECTGRFRKLAELQQHLDAGAQRVLLSVPPKDKIEATVVIGVNEGVIRKSSTIISNASCTTNCAAPLAKILHQNFTIRRGLLTTVHAYTADQRLVDTPHKDARRSRSAALNIVPTSTGAARTLGLVMPELEGRFDGLAMRVPVANGSITDLTVELGQETTVEKINEVVREAAAGSMQGIVQFCEDPIVSSDIIGNPYSCIFDADLTRIMDGNFVKVVAWYDNEWGYSSRMDDLIGLVARMDGLTEKS